MSIVEGQTPQQIPGKEEMAAEELGEPVGAQDVQARHLPHASTHG